MLRAVCMQINPVWYVQSALALNECKPPLTHSSAGALCAYRGCEPRPVLS